MHRRTWAVLMLFLSLACGGAEDILGPDGAALPLTSDNLTGRWEEMARIYAKIGFQTGVLRDTVRVSAADQIIYQFNIDGAGIVRRVQPNPGQAVFRIEPTGDALSWVIGTSESYAARLSATRLSLNNGLQVVHKFPGDDFHSPAQVTHVFAPAEVP